VTSGGGPGPRRLARCCWHEVEEQVDRATLLKRIAAAMLMTAAIALYFSDVS
jgi:hypothetical protein